MYRQELEVAMHCQVCGKEIGAGQRFCPACGTRVALDAPPRGTAGYPPVHRVGAPVPFQTADRVARNLRPLGVLWCVYGGFRLIRGVIGILIFRTMTLLSMGDGGWPMGRGFHANFPAWLGALVPMFAALTVLGTLLSFATGYGLLTRQPWGRTLAIVAAALSLIKVPFGTALGVYTLWVLAPASSNLDYETARTQQPADSTYPVPPL